MVCATPDAFSKDDLLAIVRSRIWHFTATFLIAFLFGVSDPLCFYMLSEDALLHICTFIYCCFNFGFQDARKTIIYQVLSR